MENEGLATELLHELKQSSKRWFTAFIIVLVLWFATIGVFIWYISLPIEEIEITQDADNANRSVQIVGGDNYGTTDLQKETSGN